MATNKSNIQGTVSLLRQSLMLVVYLVLVGFGVLFLFDYAFGIIIIGTGLFAIGGVTLAFRRLIWDSYAEGFKSRTVKGIAKKLSEPSLLAYKLNIFLILPLLMLLGATLVIAGIFSSLT